MTPRAIRMVKNPADDRLAIVDAAIRCFERYGPQRTSMSDIAEEAGISRRTLYRVFEDRTSLTEEILQRRLLGMGDAVRDHLQNYGDIEEALVEGSLYSVDIAERDELFSQVVAHAQGRSAEQFLLGGSENVWKALATAWAPLLERGRAENRVRTNLSNRRICELIAAVQTTILMRDDISQEQRRELLRDLLIPAILRSPAEPS